MISKDINLKFIGEEPGAQCLTVANTHDYGHDATDLALMLNEMDLETIIGCAHCVARLTITSSALPRAPYCGG